MLAAAAADDAQPTSTSAETALQAALASHKAGDYASATAHYKATLALRPQLHQVWSNYAACLKALGQNARAEQAWRRATKLKPDYAEAHFNLAVLLSEQADRLDEAKHHAEEALAHRQQYVAAHHLMGNLLVSLGRPAEATHHYQIADGLAPETTAAAAVAADARGATRAAAAPRVLPRLDGVAVGHTRAIELDGARAVELTTLSLVPLVLRATDYLTDDECTELIELARPRMAASLVMGNASTGAAARTSSSAFLPRVSSPLLARLERRLATVASLPPELLRESEELQVVSYAEGASFGMHMDTSKFQPRYLTAFYYLTDVFEGGETYFPAADGGLPAAEALALRGEALDAAAGGLRVAPARRSAILWYNHDEFGAIEPCSAHAGLTVVRGVKWAANHWVKHP